MAPSDILKKTTELVTQSQESARLSPDEPVRDLANGFKTTTMDEKLQSEIFSALMSNDNVLPASSTNTTFYTSDGEEIAAILTRDRGIIFNSEVLEKVGIDKATIAKLEDREYTVQQEATPPEVQPTHLEALIKYAKTMQPPAFSEGIVEKHQKAVIAMVEALPEFAEANNKQWSKHPVSKEQIAEILSSQEHIVQIALSENAKEKATKYLNFRMRSNARHAAEEILNPALAAKKEEVREEKWVKYQPTDDQLVELRKKVDSTSVPLEHYIDVALFENARRINIEVHGKNDNPEVKTLVTQYDKAEPQATIGDEIDRMETVNKQIQAINQKAAVNAPPTAKKPLTAAEIRRIATKNVIKTIGDDKWTEYQPTDETINRIVTHIAKSGIDSENKVLQAEQQIAHQLLKVAERKNGLTADLLVDGLSSDQIKAIEAIRADYSGRTFGKRYDDQITAIEELKAPIQAIIDRKETTVYTEAAPATTTRSPTASIAFTDDKEIHGNLNNLRVGQIYETGNDKLFQINQNVLGNTVLLEITLQYNDKVEIERISGDNFAQDLVQFVNENGQTITSIEDKETAKIVRDIGNQYLGFTGIPQYAADAAANPNKKSLEPEEIREIEQAVASAGRDISQTQEPPQGRRKWKEIDRDDETSAEQPRILRHSRQDREETTEPQGRNGIAFAVAGAISTVMGCVLGNDKKQEKEQSWVEKAGKAALVIGGVAGMAIGAVEVYKQVTTGNMQQRH